uniref:Interferon-related developmental regulator N-terminal domain-containing protein n=1 Tax=Percolomonas cosmopolitus TaxID=63605 RepID=A0A7S1KLF2_9EUKA|mmetsp:Transcript_10837/g.40471  ORF Transcript_10837/g.40471 Transcript_10837/m.40471 type:complete len:372 (+) Transcript_10837:238-1353(+)
MSSTIDTLSDTASESLNTDEDLNLDIISETWADKAKDAVEKLSTKDQETRVKYFKFLLAVMRKHYAAEDLSSEMDTIRERCEWALLKGSDDEKKVASKLFNVLLLTFPEIEMKSKIESSLKFTTTDQDDDKKSREIALSNLYFYKFVQMEEDLHDELRDLRELFLDPEVNVAAVNMYALLITLLNDEAKSDLLEDLGLHLQPILEQDNSADFNIATGKLLCQLVEAYHRRERTDCDFVIYKLTQLMEEHSMYTGRIVHSKRDAKEQRKMFREFLDTFENQTEPVHTVTVNGHEINLEGWNSVVRYDSLRDVLKGGINEHITENEVVREMLDIYQDTSERKGGLTKAQKQNRSKRDRYQDDKKHKSWNSGFV